MDHFQIKVSKVNEPSGLATVEGLGRMEVCEILMVCEDLYRERGPVEVVSPRLQGTDDSKDFSIVDVIVSFCQGERLGDVGAGVPFTIQVSLEEDGAKGILAGIGGNGKGCSKVREAKDWFGQEQGFEGVKSVLASGGPVPRQVLFGEVNEGLGDIGVIRGKVSVEVGKPEEGSDVFDFLGGRPAGDTV